MIIDFLKMINILLVEKYVPIKNLEKINESHSYIFNFETFSHLENKM